MAGSFGENKSRRYLQFAAYLLLSGLAGIIAFTLVQKVALQQLASQTQIDAQVWAAQLSRNIPALPQVARGGMPSGDTQALLRQAREIGRIHSFRIYDAEGRLTLWSGDLAKTRSRNLTTEKIGAEFSDAVRDGEAVTFIHQGKLTGEPAYFASTISPIMDEGKTAGWLVTNVDQVERHALFFSLATRLSFTVGGLLIVAPILGFWYRARQKTVVERQLKILSQHDQLTGLPNMGSFLSRIDAQLSGSGNDASQCALIVCEIADLNLIDQNFGQQAADNAVLLTSSRLSEIKPELSEIAYLDHGRYGVFVHGVTDTMAVLSLAKDLSSRLSEPVGWHGEEIAVQVHAGIALSASDGREAAPLLRSAELALRSAQEQGTPGYGFFNPEIAQDTRRRLAVQRAVADAVTARSFRLDFQPVYNIRTGELNGFEALIRLHDAELGSISPVEFIPIAEQAGLINRIGAWCLEEACRVASQWPAHLVVSVNLSPAQFYSGSLMNDVRHALDQNHFPSYRLEVEITEGTLLKDSELVLQQLRVLRDMGVAVALDDFGTGYSSLSYLWKFPFSKIKIDRSFIQALDETQSARGILRSIVKLGHGLGLTVTAEGIESTKQLTALRDLGCDLAQGYLLDRPAHVTDLAAIILRNFAKGLSRRSRESATPDVPQVNEKISSGA
ncbi:MAG: EAL domain-containing protein [Rhizobiales bacterium]|nr:EAL domain-containing protein [Hyphomicrobiales bacterium]